MNTIEQMIQTLCPDGVKRVRLGELEDSGIITLGRGKVISKEDIRNNPGEYPVYSSSSVGNGEIGRYGHYMFDDERISWSIDGGGKFFYRNAPKYSITNVSGWLLVNQKDKLSTRFLYYALFNEWGNKKYDYNHKAHPSVIREEYTIPLPPLPIQAEIVKILDRFAVLTAELEAELEDRRKQYEYYRTLLLDFSEGKKQAYEGQRDPRTRLLSFDADADSISVQWMQLGEVGPVRMCKRIMKSETNNIGGIPFYKIGTFGSKCDAYISPSLYEEYKKKYSYPTKGTILLSAAGTIGKSVIFDGEPSYFQDSNIVWIENDEKVALNKYLFYCYQVINWKVDDGGVVKRLYNENLRNTLIPIPPLSEQERIVNILDKFDQLVNGVKDSIPALIDDVQKQYEYYRNKLLTFPE